MFNCGLSIQKWWRTCMDVIFQKSRNTITPPTQILSDPSPVLYNYEGFSLLLPADHLLPAYQRDHIRYDQFLPHLAKHLPDDSIVIDIGANCGDTLAGMAQFNDRSRYICIEADDSFFDILNENIKRIKNARPNLNAQTLKYLVGTALQVASLEGTGGTKHAVIGNSGNLASIPLDDIIEKFGLEKVFLLKSDVDGFDYNVIESGMNSIRRDRPLIFFECHHSDADQIRGFEDILRKLESVGYCDWTLFDNFGEVMVRTKETNIAQQLFGYIAKQNRKETTRTIYYLDILAAPKEKIEFVDRVLKTY